MNEYGENGIRIKNWLYWIRKIAGFSIEIYFLDFRLVFKFFADKEWAIECRRWVFPKPTSGYKLHFNYVVTADRDNVMVTEYSGSSDVISDFSNAPYDNMTYGSINDVGRQWIRKYGLALTKELLGIIRSKYGALPIPGAETSLDGDTLRNEASAEKEVLVTQLREMLDQTSRRALLEADKDESEFLQEKLKRVPYPIYIG